MSGPIVYETTCIDCGARYEASYGAPHLPCPERVCTTCGYSKVVSTEGDPYNPQPGKVPTKRVCLVCLQRRVETLEARFAPSLPKLCTETT